MSKSCFELPWLGRFLLLAGVLGASCAGPDEREHPSHPQPRIPDSLEVAVFRGDEVVLHEGRLRRTFEDGGTITSFAHEFQPEGPFLVRTGRDSKGRHRSEWVPLIAEGSSLWLPRAATWYYVCNSLDCASCRPNLDRTSCECPGGETCVFGIEQGLYPTEVLTN